MTNADIFKSVFGLYATELWAMPEKDFLKWLNDEQPEPCEDAVSRQALIEALMLYQWHDDDGFPIDDCDEKRKWIEGWLPVLPSVTPKPQTGAYPNYCPHCGAYMRREKDHG